MAKFSNSIALKRIPRGGFSLQKKRFSKEELLGPCRLRCEICGTTDRQCFRFPRNSSRFKEWANFAQLTEKRLAASKKPYLCYIHFEESEIYEMRLDVKRLESDAVPTRYPPFDELKEEIHPMIFDEYYKPSIYDSFPESVPLTCNINDCSEQSQLSEIDAGRKEVFNSSSAKSYFSGGNYKNRSYFRRTFSRKKEILNSSRAKLILNKENDCNIETNVGSISLTCSNFSSTNQNVLFDKGYTLDKNKSNEFENHFDLKEELNSSCTKSQTKTKEACNGKSVKSNSLTSNSYPKLTLTNQNKLSAPGNTLRTIYRPGLKKKSLKNISKKEKMSQKLFTSKLNNSKPTDKKSKTISNNSSPVLVLSNSENFKLPAHEVVHFSEENIDKSSTSSPVNIEPSDISEEVMLIIPFDEFPISASSNRNESQASNPPEMVQAKTVGEHVEKSIKEPQQIIQPQKANVALDSPDQTLIRQIFTELGHKRFTCHYCGTPTNHRSVLKMHIQYYHQRKISDLSAGV